MIQLVLSILFLALMECMLSLDNALALAATVHHLPEGLRRRALTYGVLGAFAFRWVALFFMVHLLNLFIVKVIVAAYLIYLSVNFFLKGGSDAEKGPPEVAKGEHFWWIVVLVELTDVAFSLDSIMAGAALSQQLWVIFSGGILGIIAMRFAAEAFVNLMDRLPRLETAAYLFILLTGLKLIVVAFAQSLVDFDSSASLPFWLFWGGMIASLGYGMLPQTKKLAKQTA
jgi:YkoY family integral membrane protein